MLPGVFRPKEALVTNCSERTGVKNLQGILQDFPHLVDHTRRFNRRLRFIIFLSENFYENLTLDSSSELLPLLYPELNRWPLTKTSDTTQT